MEVYTGKHLPDAFPIQFGLKQGDALLTLQVFDNRVLQTVFGCYRAEITKRMEKIA
jgi:hypothetical protein